MHGTTILCVRRAGKLVLAGDGQVTLGSEVLKATTNKLRRIYKDKILAGFAGSTADAFALFARFEAKLEAHNGNLPRAVVELAKDWRNDKVLRHLDALLLVADGKNIYILSGQGDVIEPDGECASIGSGGGFAKPRRRVENTRGRPRFRKSYEIAADTCIYTNTTCLPGAA